MFMNNNPFDHLWFGGLGLGTCDKGHVGFPFKAPCKGKPKGLCIAYM